MDASEGKGPGVGGHAIKEHGHAREDVTDRNKSEDGAFKRGWSVKTTTSFEDSVMGGVFDDYDSSEHIKRFTRSSDQYLAVCNALNSEYGQAKLKELDGLADDSQMVVFNAPVNLSLPIKVRTAQHGVESEDSFAQVHIELCKIGGKLHLHTAFAVKEPPGKNALKKMRRAISNANI